MSTSRHGTRRSHTAPVILRLLVGAAVGLALPPAALAATTQDVDPAASPYTGRDFAGVDLPVTPQRADVRLEGLRTFAWNEGVTKRLLIEGNVRIKIGAFDFTADRATVWIEPVQLAGQPLEQIAVYLDNARDPGAAAEVSQSAERLLVTAIIEGEQTLQTNRLLQRRPAGAFLEAGERRLAAYLARAGGDQPPGVMINPEWTPPTLVDRRPISPPGFAPPPGEGNLARVPQAPPIFAEQGLVSFFGPDRTLVTGEDENALVITGGVVAQYTDVVTNRTLQISADRLVVFLDPRSVTDLMRFGPGEVRGIYLEGDVVATDGQYTLRGPRFFYDVTNNRGIVLDAVFTTFDQERGMPIYVRADVVRQESANQWSAG
ncbi:MAG: hypothetical protein VYC34_09755, partial [Planctomycetota bacterium]|nr:hypothetical protein [Planctomycetota bacterium]